MKRPSNTERSKESARLREAALSGAVAKRPVKARTVSAGQRVSLICTCVLVLSMIAMRLLPVERTAASSSFDVLGRLASGTHGTLPLVALCVTVFCVAVALATLPLLKPADNTPSGERHGTARLIVTTAIWAGTLIAVMTCLLWTVRAVKIEPMARAHERAVAIVERSQTLAESHDLFWTAYDRGQTPIREKAQLLIQDMYAYLQDHAGDATPADNDAVRSALCKQLMLMERYADAGVAIAGWRRTSGPQSNQQIQATTATLTELMRKAGLLRDIPPISTGRYEIDALPKIERLYDAQDYANGALEAEKYLASVGTDETVLADPERRARVAAVFALKAACLGPGDHPDSEEVRKVARKGLAMAEEGMKLVTLPLEKWALFAMAASQCHTVLSDDAARQGQYNAVIESSGNAKVVLEDLVFRLGSKGFAEALVKMCENVEWAHESLNDKPALERAIAERVRVCKKLVEMGMTRWQDKVELGEKELGKTVPVRS